MPAGIPEVMGLARESLDYDPCSGLFRNRHARGARALAGEIAGSLNGHGYVQIVLGRRQLLAHRLAWFFVHGVLPKGQVDHINGNKTDNRIQNLRDVSKAQNIQAIFVARADSSTGVRGVDFCGGRFRARIHASKKTYHLGFFDSLEEAQAAYLAAKAELHPASAASRPHFAEAITCRVIEQVQTMPEAAYCVFQPLRRTA